MGKRLHSHIKHEIVYSQSEGLNWQVDAFDNMVSTFCTDFWNSGDDFSTGDEYEIDREQFKAMIEEIKAMSNTDFAAHEFGFDDKFSKDYIVEVLESLLKEADPTKNYIYLSWF